MMDKLKSSLANDFKIASNEYLILIVLMMVGCAFVPFTFLWIPMLGILYLIVMLGLLFQGLNKILYLSVFDKSSKFFEGYLENIGAALVSKCFVSAVGMIEILLLPVATVALTVSMNALEWQEVFDWYAGFCTDSTMIKPVLFAEAINVVANCILTGALLMLATICMAKVLRKAKSQSVRECIQIVVYLLCALMGAAIYLWWLLLGLENSLIYCGLSIIVKLGLCAALIPVMKKQIITIYEES